MEHPAASFSPPSTPVPAPPALTSAPPMPPPPRIGSAEGPAFTTAQQAVDGTGNAGVVGIVASLVCFFAGAALNLPILWLVGLVFFVAGLVVRSRTRKNAVASLSSDQRAEAKSTLKSGRVVILLIALAGMVRFAFVELLNR